MKRITHLITTTAAASALFWTGQAKAQQQPRELGAMALMADGKRMRGFVQNSNAKGLLFTLVEGSPGQGYAWKTQVVAVAFDDADEIMREARAAYTQRKYEQAAELCGAVADGYPQVAWIPNNFATEARYYQIESLRHLGRWEEIGPLLETPAGVTIPTQLSDFSQPQHKLNQLWAQLGAGQLDGVKAEIDSRQIPQTGQAKLLPSPAFREMPMRELVQITYMRAKVAEAEGNDKMALEDYYRTFSYSYGNDKVMTGLAMNAALTIQAKNPALQGEELENTPALRQMQSLAYLYKNAFGGGSIDPAYEKFAVKPELPKPPEPKETEAEKKAAEGEATPAPAADGEKKEAPADEKKKDAPANQKKDGKKKEAPANPKAKGKEKAKAKAEK